MYNYMYPMFENFIEQEFEVAILSDIDVWFEVNGTRKYFPFLANTTFDIGTEEGQVKFNQNNVLTMPVNGTFFDPNAKGASAYTPPDI